jgi:hypothetical protein
VWLLSCHVATRRAKRSATIHQSACQLPACTVCTRHQDGTPSRSSCREIWRGLNSSSLFGRTRVTAAYHHECHSTQKLNALNIEYTLHTQECSTANLDATGSGLLASARRCSPPPCHSYAPSHVAFLAAYDCSSCAAALPEPELYSICQPDL